MKGNKNNYRSLPKDYQPLYQYLMRRDWRNADLATRELMLKIAQVRGRRDLLLTKGDLQTFPCVDLFRINQLWYLASEGKFCFEITYELYQSHEGNYEKLAELVGWKQGKKWIHFDEIIFSFDAPQGHLPLVWLVPTTFSIYWCARFASAGWGLMFNRWQNCQDIRVIK